MTLAILLPGSRLLFIGRKVANNISNSTLDDMFNCRREIFEVDSGIYHLFHELHSQEMIQLKRREKSIDEKIGSVKFTVNYSHIITYQN